MKQELALKDAEIKKYRAEIKQEKDLKKQGFEAASKNDSRLSFAHAEREEALKAATAAEHKLKAEIGERDEKIKRLEDRLALFSGDTGVPAHEIERALKMVRNATDDSSMDASSLRLVDTDLNALGLSPLAKKEVQNILLQNNDLIKDLEKTELLLKNQTKLGAALTAELEAAKRTAAEEVSRLQRREAQRTSELADAKRQVMQMQELYSGKEPMGRGVGSTTASGFPKSMLPPGMDRGLDTESVADSIISDGTHEELDVRPDENIFELRVIRAALTSTAFAARPSTFCSFDFYQHDTQASPMRQGLDPEYDFTAQYVLTVDDLFLHYAATAVLAIEVYQSLGVECALVGRTDAPLRELLQGRRGRIMKHAQLYAVADSASTGAPKVIGTLIYEFRMRRRIDASVHSFMQRFPDVASLAMMEVRPGARTSEAIVTVKSCTGLRLRVGGAGPPAPYVHFDFFEFGEQETHAREGSDPIYEQQFRFPVDREGDFSEYLKQKSLKFSVFDENEEDTEAMVGQGELPLAPLLAAPLLNEPAITLLDLKGKAAGTLAVSVELREQSTPKPISLRAGVGGKAGGADKAAMSIQAAYRGKSVRKSGVGVAHGLEAPVPLTVGVTQLKLNDEILRTAGSAVWVEVDLAGVTKEPLRTKRAPPRGTADLSFEQTINVTSQAKEAEALRRALNSPTPQEADVLVTAMAAGASGNRQIGVGYLSLKDLHTSGRDLSGGTTVALRGKENRRVGSCDVSLAALAAVHRAFAPDTIRVCVNSLTIPEDLVRDQSVSELWVEIDLGCLALPTAVRTRALAKSASERQPLDFEFTHSVGAPPGSAALASLQKALASKEESDSDVYFVLKARGKGQPGQRGGAADREVAEGFVNLEALLRERRDYVNVPLTLANKTRGGEPASLSVSVLCYEALRRIKAPVAQSDAVRIDVGELVVTDALQTDGSIMEVWMEVDVLDLDGGQPLRTAPLRKNARKLDFEFTQLLSINPDYLESLRKALASSDEQASDVYFTLKGRGPRGERELAQGFVNLKQLLKEGKDHEREPLRLVSQDRRTFGPVTVSVVAVDVLKRARSTRPPGTKDALRVEVGARARAVGPIRSGGWRGVGRGRRLGPRRRVAAHDASYRQPGRTRAANDGVWLHADDWRAGGLTPAGDAPVCPCLARRGGGGHLLLCEGRASRAARAAFGFRQDGPDWPGLPQLEGRPRAGSRPTRHACQAAGQAGWVRAQGLTRCPRGDSGGRAAVDSRDVRAAGPGGRRLRTAGGADDDPRAGRLARALAVDAQRPRCWRRLHRDRSRRHWR